MSGYCSTGKENMEIMPNSTITTEITPENTGRSIKNRRFISFRF